MSEPPFFPIHGNDDPERTRAYLAKQLIRVIPHLSNEEVAESVNIHVPCTAEQVRALREG